MTRIQKACKEETAQVNCKICLKSAYLYEHFGLCLFANRKSHTNQLISLSDKFCSLPLRETDMLAVPAPVTYVPQARYPSGGNRNVRLANFRAW